MKRANEAQTPHYATLPPGGQPPGPIYPNAGYSNMDYPVGYGTYPNPPPSHMYVQPY